MIEGFRLALTLQRKSPAAPRDAATFAEEADLGLTPAGSPGEKHGRQAIGVVEQQVGGVLHVIGAMTEAAGPGAHRRRRPGNVQQLVHEMGAVIEQHTAPAIGPPAAPRHDAGVGAPVGREPVHAEFREIPAADHLLIEPAFYTAPHRIEAVLMAGHHDPAGALCRGRERGGFGARHRDRLFAQHVIALRQRPERQCHVR